MIGAVRVWAAAAIIAAGPAPAAGQSAAPGAYLDYDGLAYVNMAGHVRHVPFGTSARKLLAVTERLHGAPETSTNPECGAGPIDFAAYANGLTLHIQDGAFVGWSTSVPGVRTLDGIGVGSTVMDMETTAGPVAIEQTTLGYEFWHEDFFGILDAPDGVIQTVWGGTSCNFR